MSDKYLIGANTRDTAQSYVDYLHNATHDGGRVGVVVPDRRVVAGNNVAASDSGDDYNGYFKIVIKEEVEELPEGETLPEGEEPKKKYYLYVVDGVTYDPDYKYEEDTYPSGYNVLRFNGNDIYMNPYKIELPAYGDEGVSFRVWLVCIFTPYLDGFKTDYHVVFDTSTSWPGTPHIPTRNVFCLELASVRWLPESKSYYWYISNYVKTFGALVNTNNALTNVYKFSGCPVVQWVKKASADVDNKFVLDSSIYTGVRRLLSNYKVYVSIVDRDTFIGDLNTPLPEDIISGPIWFSVNDKVYETHPVNVELPFPLPKDFYLAFFLVWEIVVIDGIVTTKSEIVKSYDKKFVPNFENGAYVKMCVISNYNETDSYMITMQVNTTPSDNMYHLYHTLNCELRELIL